MVDAQSRKDEKSQDALFDVLDSEYRARLVYFLEKSFSSEASQAEDVVQESLLSFQEQILDGRIDPDCNLFNFLLTIAKNKMIDLLRKPSRRFVNRTRTYENVIAGIKGSRLSGFLSDPLIAQEVFERLWKLAKNSAKFNYGKILIVILDAYPEDLTPKEIKIELAVQNIEMSINTIYSGLKEARIKCRHVIYDE